MPTVICSSQLRSGSQLRTGSAHCDLQLAVEVDLAVPTVICSSQLRSGSAHCELELVVVARQCPL